MTDSTSTTTSKPTQHRMSKRIELDIVPGKGLGPFRLGSSLWDVIHFLSDRPQLFPSVELKYSQEEPLKYDFIIALPVNGLHLRFDGSAQRLRSVECYDPNKVKLVYQHSEVSSSRTIPTFLLIYKSFGPTYPGEFDAEQSIYTLKYPGLAFTFPIPLRHQHLYKPSHDSSTTADLPLELPDGTTPITSKVIIYSSQCDRWQQSVVPASQLSRIIAEANNTTSSATTLRSVIRNYGKIGRREVENVIVKPTIGITMKFPTFNHASTEGTSSSSNSNDHTKINTSSPLMAPSSSALASSPSPSQQHPHSRQTSGNSHTHVSQQIVNVNLNHSTVQDILVDLGKPSKIFYKEEDKMKIHSVKNAASSTKVATTPVAHKNGKNSTILDDNDLNHMEDNGSSSSSSSNGGGTSDDNTSDNTDYFLNYFHLGIDILIDGGLHVCKKIILHGNVPGHYDFQRYKRCPFQINFPKSIIKQYIQKEKEQQYGQKKHQLVDIVEDEDNDFLQYTITADMKVDEMKQRIPWDSSFVPVTSGSGGNSGHNGNKKTVTAQATEQKPVILTRGSSEQNPFGSTHLTGYDEGIVMEVMKNGYIPTVVLF